MSFKTRYIFSASMDVSPESESLFNEVYDDEHVPMLLEVPGVVAVSRLITEELKWPWVARSMWCQTMESPDIVLCIR